MHDSVIQLNEWRFLSFKCFVSKKVLIIVLRLLY